MRPLVVYLKKLAPLLLFYLPFFITNMITSIREVSDIFVSIYIGLDLN